MSLWNTRFEHWRFKDLQEIFDLLGVRQLHNVMLVASARHIHRNEETRTDNLLQFRSSPSLKVRFRSNAKDFQILRPHVGEEEP